MTARSARLPDGPEKTFEGVAVPARRYTARGDEGSRYGLALGALTLTLAIATGAVAAWDKVATKEAVFACPPDCGRPPTALPVSAMPRFVAADGAFSVGHPQSDVPDAGGNTYTVSTRPDGLSALKLGGDGGELQLFGEPSDGRVARQVVEDLINKKFKDATIAFEIPNATVGYQLGYGVVVNFQQPGSLIVSRAILMAAVKKDLALVATAEGPFRRFTPDFGPGLPSAANLEIAMEMSKYADSFSWRGDPPR
ncbi:MAG: hypothetical protein ACOYB7_00080 [Mycobacterium sp.]